MGGRAVIPGYPDYRPHLRCEQCCRYLPSEDAVARFLNDLDIKPLCVECDWMMRKRGHTPSKKRRRP